jgi:predicted enzyme related to lactoylglutathione lyase
MSEAHGSVQAGVPQLAVTEVRVVDWESTVRWYEEVLGLHTLLIDDHNQFALLAAGTGRIALKGPGERGSVRPARRAEGVRLIFRIDDVDAEYARLVGLKVNVSRPADHPREHYREVRTEDPEGNPITLFAWRGEPPAAGAPVTY